MEHQEIELLPRAVEDALPSHIVHPKECETDLEDVDAQELSLAQIFHELKDLSSEWWELARAMDIPFNRRMEWKDSVQMRNDQRLETSINEWCEIKQIVTQHDLNKILMKIGRGLVHIPLSESEVWNILRNKADKWEEIQDKMSVRLNNEEIHLSDDKKKSDEDLLRNVIHKWFRLRETRAVKRDDVVQILEKLEYQDLIKEYKPLTVEEVYDEINKYQLKPSEWWEIGGDLSINKDDRNELRKNELLKDDNRLERVLWLASQQSVLTENKLNHVSKLLHSKQEQLKYEKRLLFQHVAVAVVITVIVLHLIIAGCVTSIILTGQHNTTTGNVYMNTDDSFIINRQGFSNNLESVDLTFTGNLSFFDSMLMVNVYMTECDQVMELNRTLLNSKYDFTTRASGIHSFNYISALPGETPLYGLSGRVDFDISSLDLQNSTDTKCSVIYIFNDYTSYKRSIDKGKVEGNITRSPCLPVGPFGSPPTITHWSYEFNTEQYVYITLDLKTGINFNSNITGYVIVHNTPSNSLLHGCNDLKPAMSMCNIDLCSSTCSIGGGSSEPKQCILAALSENPFTQDNFQMQYTTVPPMYTLNFLLILIFLVLLPLIFLIVGMAIDFGVYHCRKMSNRSKNY